MSFFIFKERKKFMQEYNIWFSKLKLDNKCKLSLLENFRLEELYNFSEKNLKSIDIKENIKKNYAI